MSHKFYNFELIENETDKKIFRIRGSRNDLYVGIEHSFLFDDKNPDLSLHFHVETNTNIKGFKEKIKSIKDIIFNKPLKYDKVFSFWGRRQIEDFCDFIFLLSKNVKKETTELEETKKELRKLMNKYNEHKN